MSTQLFDHLDFRNIDREEQLRRCTTSAHKALLEYDLKACKITGVQNFLGENKWHVECESGPYLLIMSYPVKIWDFAPTKQFLQSQLSWMHFLESETNLTLQTPQKNKHGSLVTTIKLLDGDLQCALLKWVEGDDISKPSTSDAKNMGKMSAQIHNTTRKWHPKEKIVRRLIDTNRLKKTMTTLQHLTHTNHIDPNYFSVLQACLSKVLTQWQQAPPQTLMTSIVHADFNANNCLKFENDIRPIDFEGSHIAPQPWDLATSLRAWKKQNVPHQDQIDAFLNGYASIIPLNTKYLALVEAFIIWAIIEKAWAKTGDNPRLNFSHYDLFKTAMFDPFLADKSFLLI